MPKKKRERESIQNARAKLFAFHIKMVLSDTIALLATSIVVITLNIFFDGKLISFKLTPLGLGGQYITIGQLFLFWLLGSLASIFITATIGFARDLREIKTERKID